MRSSLEALYKLINRNISKIGRIFKKSRTKSEILKINNILKLFQINLSNVYAISKLNIYSDHPHEIHILMNIIKLL